MSKSLPSIEDRANVLRQESLARLQASIAADPEGYRKWRGEIDRAHDLKDQRRNQAWSLGLSIREFEE